MLAMGVPRAEALSSLRVSFGHTNDDGELDAFVEALGRQVTELRALATA